MNLQKRVPSSGSGVSPSAAASTLVAVLALRELRRPAQRRGVGFGRQPRNWPRRNPQPASILYWERFSLSAFCGAGGAKWGEGRGEVPRLSIGT
jgi:hypothetical protein